MSAVPPHPSPSFSSAGPQLQALDRSVPRRTRTTSTGSERCPPDLHLELRISVPRQTSTQRISKDIPDRMPEKMSEDMPDTYARKNVKENVRRSARKNARMNPGKDAKQNVRIDAGQNARKNVRIYAGKYVRIGAKQHVKQNAKVYAERMSDIVKQSVRINMPYIYIYTSRWYIRNYVIIVVQGGISLEESNSNWKTMGK